MEAKNIPFLKMDGSKGQLSDYEGKVVLVVNVASKCGLTPQYEGLEKLQRQYKDRGFTVVGFPANNFLAQEPGTNDEIEQFCKMTYDVTFPVFQKISVKGSDRHPLYTALMAAQPKAKPIEKSTLAADLAKYDQFPESESGILWNFEKFLIDKKGQVVARFAPDMEPASAVIQKEIESRL